MDACSIQKRMLEIQNSEEIQHIFGKLVNGKAGYKAVIDKTIPPKKCSCGKILSGDEKFCPECGNKIEPKK